MGGGMIDSWSACGRREWNRVRLLQDRASAASFSFPGKLTELKWKPWNAVKNARHHIRWLKARSCVCPLFNMFTTASLSELKQTSFHASCHPKAWQQPPQESVPKQQYSCVNHMARQAWTNTLSAESCRIQLSQMHPCTRGLMGRPVGRTSHSTSSRNKATKEY